MAYKTRIAISPDIEAELRRLKALYGLQSANKVLRLVLLKERADGHQVAAERTRRGDAN